MKAATITQTAASIRKKLPHPMALAVERNVDAISVAVIRLKKVATLIALARILVAKISDGINQAPGPIPILKNDMYKANPKIAKPVPRFLFPRKVILIKMRATHIPTCGNC
jgi:hypothetical protein